MYFYLQTSELLSGKAFNSMSNMLHFDVRNVSKIDTLFAHLDSTSFHLHREYNNIEIAENDQKRPILITKGYSHDHRPDLK